MPKPGPNVWVVRRRGAFSVREENIPFYLTEPITQRAAIEIARLIAVANQSELIIQDQGGRIRSRDSHGHDSPYRRG